MPVYPNYYQAPYINSYQPQQPLQYGQYQQIPQNVPQQQNGNGINWVQGEAGAKSFIVANGQSVWLMDSENPVFYLKSTDPSGIPLPLRIFDFSERTSQNTPVPENNVLENYVTRQELQEFENKISQIIARRGDTDNVKSDI